MSRRARSTAIEPIGFVIQRENGLRPPPTVETSPIAVRDWEAAVGTRIAARAAPVKLDHGVLWVRAATSTWAQELSLLSDPILAQLRARGVPVTALRFRVGHVDAPARPPLRDEVRTAPPAVPLPAEVMDELAHVADLDLRDAIARAAAKNLGWQSTLAKPKKPARPRSRKAPAAGAPPTSAPSGARGPRSAETGSDPPARTTGPSRGASRGRA